MKNQPFIYTIQSYLDLFYYTFFCLKKDNFIESEVSFASDVLKILVSMHWLKAEKPFFFSSPDLEYRFVQTLMEPWKH